MGAAERWYRNLAFRKKVWISFLAVSLIPVIILGAFSYFQTRKLLVQREQEVLSETLKQSVLTLNATLESCEHIMENIVWDSLIKHVPAALHGPRLRPFRALRPELTVSEQSETNVSQHQQERFRALLF